MSSLKRSADMSCSICRRIWEDIQEEWRTWEDAESFWELGRRDNQIFVIAHINKLAKHLVKEYDIYRLEFTLSGKFFPKHSIGTQLLRLTENKSSTSVYTPQNRRLDSREVLNLARFWISKCIGPEHPNCPGPDRLLSINYEPMQEVDGVSTSSSNPSRAMKAIARTATNEFPDPLFYPTRLIVLGNASSKTDTVRLLVTKHATRPDGPTLSKPEGHYVTLSHCWGKSTERNNFFCLDSSNLNTFLDTGIPLEKLPKTFFDAIHFARRLGSNVKYIWIDSLCIIQGDTDDWLHESAQMYQVYRNSYCNISATAAADSSGGLYAERDPRQLWGDDVDLNTEGLDRMGDSGSLEALIRRCKVVDPSLWHRKVDAAPVNRRAWVLQERLLAPRVLHFCEDQIAWECGKLDASESAHAGIDSLEIKSGVIRESTRLKSLVAEFDHRQTADEKWKKVVERYSLTNLTRPEDKLIALAGIAEQMSTQIGAPYVAGMWDNKYFASQLLWRVEPQWKNAKFLYPSKRPRRFRAPSFSWAAIDAPQGIRCGEILDEGLSIAVTEAMVRHDAQFDLVQEPSFIKLRCQTIRIRIDKTLRGDREDVYTWTLTDERVVQGTSILPNVYLDSPEDDFGNFDIAHIPIWLVPASKNSSGGLIGLLLQQVEDEDDAEDNENHFRRVGLSVISSHYISSEDASMDDNGEFRGVEKRVIAIY